MLELVITAAISMLGTVFVVVATPLGKMLVERTLNRRPTFYSDRYLYRNDLEVRIFPADRASRKRKFIGVFYNGMYFKDIGKLVKRDSSHYWVLDFKSSEFPTTHLIKEPKIDLRFYFNQRNVSEALRFSFLPRSLYSHTHNQNVSPSELSHDSIVEDDCNQLLTSFASMREISVDCTAIHLNLTPGVVGDHFRVNSVFDGSELVVYAVEQYKLTSPRSTSILSEARYAWVLKFEECTRIMLESLVFGHTKGGFCVGGVISFSNGSSFVATNCRMYGSGTVGVEIDDATEVLIDGCQIYECNYHTVVVKNSQGVVFSNCTFSNNREFAQFIFEGPLVDVLFVDCTVSSSLSRDVFILVGQNVDSVHSSIVFRNCTFVDNQYEQLCNRDFVKFENCEIEDVGR